MIPIADTLHKIPVLYWSIIVLVLQGCGSGSIGGSEAESASIAQLIPRIVNSNPASNERDVPVSTSVELSFNKTMDPDSLAAALSLTTDSDATIDGSIQVSEEGKKAVFTPSVSLPCSTGFTVTLTTSASDTEGNHLSATAETEFRTQPQPVDAITAGFSHNCAKLQSGEIKCWGRNEAGQLGLGDTINQGDEAGEMGEQLDPVDIGSAQTVEALIAGETHSCAILSPGPLKCWGWNDEGQLGLDDRVFRGDNAGEMGDTLPVSTLGTGRTIVEASAKNRHTCAILDNNHLKCWGYNSFGNLGLELDPGSGAVHQGDGIDPVGSPATEMGDNLLFVDLGTGRTASKVTVGRNHTCVILDNQTVKCWGENTFGQLGLEISKLVNIGDDANEMGNDLPTVNLGPGVTAAEIASGLEHVCVLLTDGTLKCWGRNDYGQLGLEDSSLRGSSAGTMGDNLPAVALGSDQAIGSIASGGHHNCVIFSDGSVKCWGRNDYGQLGQGHALSIGDNTGEMGNNLPTVNLGTGRSATALSLGRYHTCALLDNQTVKCWGYNNYGQLGLEDMENRGDEPGEMGDTLFSVDFGEK